MSKIKKIKYCNKNQIPIGKFIVHFYWYDAMLKVNGPDLEWVEGYGYDAGMGNSFAFTNSKEEKYFERIAKSLDHTKKSYVDDLKKAMELDPYKE